MNVETVFGQELKTKPSPYRPVFETRRACCARLRLRRQSLLGKSLRARRPMVPLKAAAMDIGLAKDILCAEPWWSRNPAPNMITVHSPEQMLDALQTAGNRLVVIDFYAKWCRSCRALYPKLNQICRANPDVLLLKVDWDENLELCQVMGVKALPFFHFYQSPFGCVDSFTISVSRVRKLKDTIAVYNVPLSTETSRLAGVDLPTIDFATGLNTVAAQLSKLEEIFSIT